VPVRAALAEFLAFHFLRYPHIEDALHQYRIENRWRLMFSSIGNRLLEPRFRVRQRLLAPIFMGGKTGAARRGSGTRRRSARTPLAIDRSAAAGGLTFHPPPCYLLQLLQHPLPDVRTTDNAGQLSSAAGAAWHVAELVGSCFPIKNADNPGHLAGLFSTELPYFLRFPSWHCGRLFSAIRPGPGDRNRLTSSCSSGRWEVSSWACRGISIELTHLEHVPQKASNSQTNPWPCPCRHDARLCVCDGLRRAGPPADGSVPAPQKGPVRRAGYGSDALAFLLHQHRSRRSWSWVIR